MGRFNASPSTFSQGGTSDPRKLGFGFSNEKPSTFGRNPWSRNAARQAVRREGQHGLMRPQRLADILKTLGWSVRQTAETLGVKRKVVSDWCNGKADIPPQVGEWFEAQVETGAASHHAQGGAS